MNKPYPKSKNIDLWEYQVEKNQDPAYVWETQTGECILIKDLRTSHIINILEYMKAKPGWRDDQRIILEEELQQRKIKKLIKTTKYGSIFYDDN